jgi:hypothetical protein
MPVGLSLLKRKRRQTARIPALPTFGEAFEWASDRRLHVLYDEVADELAERFQGLLDAGHGQLEVLRRIAVENDLAESAITEPLEDSESEALVQRVGWRTASRWTVLSLMWSLSAEAPVERWHVRAWANAVPRAQRTQALGPSGLSTADEAFALAFAAGLLARSFAGRESALLVSERPLVVTAPDETNVAASLVGPIALVATSTEYLGEGEDDISLEAGTPVWPGSERARSLLELNPSEEHGVAVLAEHLSLSAEDSVRLVPVVQGIALLCEW